MNDKLHVYMIFIKFGLLYLASSFQYQQTSDQMMQKLQFSAFNQIFNFSLTAQSHFHQQNETLSNLHINVVNDKDQKYQLKIYNKNIATDMKFFIEDVRCLFSFLKRIFQQQEYKSCELDKNLLKIKVSYTLQTGEIRSVSQDFIMEKINQIDSVRKYISQFSKSLLQIKTETNSKLKQFKSQIKLIIKQKMELSQRKHREEMHNIKQDLLQITRSLIQVQNNLKKTKQIQKSPKKKQKQKSHRQKPNAEKPRRVQIQEVSSNQNSQNSYEHQSQQNQIKLQNEEQEQHAHRAEQILPADLYKQTQAIIKQIKRKNGQLSPLHELSQQQVISSAFAQNCSNFFNKQQSQQQIQKSQNKKQKQKGHQNEEQHLSRSKRKAQKEKRIPINADKITFKFLKSKNKFGRFFQINQQNRQIKKIVTLQNTQKWHSLLSSKPFPPTGIHYIQVRIVKSQLYNIVLGILDSEKAMVLNQIPDTCDAIYIQDGGLHDYVGGRLKKIQNKNEWRVKERDTLELNLMDEWISNQVFFVYMRVNMDKYQLQFWYNDLFVSKTKFCKANIDNKERLHVYLALQNEDDTIQLC